MPLNIRRLCLLLALPVLTVVTGTIGFMAIEKLSFINAFYFTLTTVSTVGYGDIHAVTTAGKLFVVFIIVVGAGTFLTILSSVTQSFVASDQARLRRQRIDTLMGLFFTEVGNQLLRLLVGYDPDTAGLRREFLVNKNWSAADFNRLKATLQQGEQNIDPKLVDLEALAALLKARGGFLVRQLENPDLIDNESYADLLWASVHLRDELMARTSLNGLPETDVAHLSNDAKRVYNLLIRQWLDYMRYLQGKYPYLFSLAVRNSPFNENPSVTVT